MKKNIVNFILTLILAYVLSLFMDWYSVMIAAFITAVLVPLKRSAVFFVPFLAVFLLWVFQTYSLSNANDFILAKKISELLTLGGNPYVLMLVTGVVGGIAAGIAAVFGKQLRFDVTQ